MVVVVIVVLLLLLLLVTSLLLILRLLLALVTALLVLRLLLALVTAAATALLVAILLLISTATTMMVRLLVPVVRMVSVIALRELRRHLRGSALEVDVYPASIGFCRVLQTEFSTYLLDAWFDLLDVVRGVVPFADDAVQNFCSGWLRSRFVFFCFLFLGEGGREMIRA